MPQLDFKDGHVDSRMPDAIGIGFRRAGSSWLHEILNQHHQIGKPKDGLHFFSENSDNGLNWYKDQFRAFKTADVVVDFSISYAYPEYSHNVATQIFEILPNIKLFAALRNPIERAFSDYLRSVRRLEIPKEVSFGDAVQKWPILLERGLYGQNLLTYFDLFPKEHIHIMFYDDLLVDSELYVRSLLGFLGVDFDEELNLERKEPVGKKIVSKTLVNSIFLVKNNMEKIFNTVGMPNIWNQVKERFHGVYQGVLSLNERDEDLDGDTKAYLQDYYRDDIAILSKLTDRNLSSWSQ